MANRKIPATMRQIIVNTLGTDFRKVTSVTEVPVPKLGAEEVLVKNMYVGINASDVNYTAGRYDPTMKPPFAAGFEGLGKVVAAGEKSAVKEGQAVVYTQAGAFSDYVVVPSTKLVPVPSMDPAFISILVSGLTASISLEKEGDLKEGKTVLITAAAGGTGQFAVQLAKQAGCHVIGTCSNNSKVEFLKSIGCDRPINYKEEDLKTVLSKEYPKGIDVVYESIGKEIFDTCLKNLAVHGRLIVIGMISGYHNEETIESGATSNIPLSMLRKSARVSGFFLPHYHKDIPRHTESLFKMYIGKKIRVGVDKGSEKPFLGLASVADAIDYMYSGKNVGKVVVELDTDKSSL